MALRKRLSSHQRRTTALDDLQGGINATTSPTAASHHQADAALAIPGRPEHVRDARAFTELVLAVHQLADDGIAGLLVSELVTNSLQHSDSGRPGGTVTVTVAVIAGDVLVEVTDEGGAAHPAPRDGGTDEEDGRGLHLAEQLAADWGYTGGKGRLSTWFELKPASNPLPNGQ
jgi:serine/threonine-protein kinase RsbW